MTRMPSHLTSYAHRSSSVGSAAAVASIGATNRGIRSARAMARSDGGCRTTASERGASTTWPSSRTVCDLTSSRAAIALGARRSAVPLVQLPAVSAIAEVGEDGEGAAVHDDEVAVALDLGGPRPGVRELRLPPAKGEEPPVPVEHLGVSPLLAFVPAQPALLERLDGEGIGELVPMVAQLGELLAAALDHRRPQRRVLEVGEEAKRRRRAPLLALEQQWRARTEQDHARRQLRRAGADEVDEALATGAIADLIVVLRGDDEPVSGRVADGSAVAPLPAVRPAPIEVVDVAERSRHGIDRCVVDEVVRPFAGEDRVQPVMEVIGPASRRARTPRPRAAP